MTASATSDAVRTDAATLPVAWISLVPFPAPAAMEPPLRAHTPAPNPDDDDDDDDSGRGGGSGGSIDPDDDEDVDDDEDGDEDGDEDPLWVLALAARRGGIILRG